MNEHNHTVEEPKKSLNFIEQMVKNDLREGKTTDVYKPDSRLSQTVIAYRTR